MCGGSILTTLLTDTRGKIMSVDWAQEKEKHQGHDRGIVRSAECLRTQREFCSQITIEGEASNAPGREIHEDIGEERAKPTGKGGVILQVNVEGICQEEPNRSDQSKSITDGENQYEDTAGDLSHPSAGKGDDREDVADESQEIDHGIDNGSDSIAKCIVVEWVIRRKHERIGGAIEEKAWVRHWCRWRKCETFARRSLQLFAGRKWRQMEVDSSFLLRMWIYSSFQLPVGEKSQNASASDIIVIKKESSSLTIRYLSCSSLTLSVPKSRFLPLTFVVYSSKHVIFSPSSDVKDKGNRRINTPKWLDKSYSLVEIRWWKIVQICRCLLSRIVGEDSLFQTRFSWRKIDAVFDWRRRRRGRMVFSSTLLRQG